MEVNFKPNQLKETITNTKVIALSPLKTDWKSLTDSLMKLKIDILPTDDSIPSYQPSYSNNQPTFSFEYATPEVYRFFQYNDIYRAPDEFWQPRNVLAILDLLNEEFDWYLLGKK